jgi:hypothetical protein
MQLSGRAMHKVPPPITVELGISFQVIIFVAHIQSIADLDWEVLTPCDFWKVNSHIVVCFRSLRVEKWFLRKIRDTVKPWKLGMMHI